MQTPDEFAIAVTEPCPEVSDGMCFHSAPVGRCIDLKAAADLIRARDAEVAARAWDEAVAAVAWAMDHGPEPLRYVGENNPYKREAGERDE